MDININNKIIKEMCGTLSFKKGEAYYRSDKVRFNQYNENSCDATVIGTEDFHVTIEKEVNGDLRRVCSCPSLANFQKDCQHIAAVLLAINDHQHKGTSPLNLQKQANDGELTKGFMTLFKDTLTNASGHQRYFEKRAVLDVSFTCKAISVNGQHLFGIEIELKNQKLLQIRNFLLGVKRGEQVKVSPEFTYNPSTHCFSIEADAIIHHLIRVVHDEVAFLESMSNTSRYEGTNETLIIPPSSWMRLVPLLSASLAKLEYNERCFESLRVVEGTPPIQFLFDETSKDNFQLTVKGFERMLVLNSYRSVLCDGQVFQLDRKDCNRLFELKQMLPFPDTNYIPIPLKHINHFLEKIVPDLKKIGHVELSRALNQRFFETPLTAKLYLDRLKNRLLAGLEFHYEGVVIQPLEGRDVPTGPMIIRDLEKEEEILQLMDESGFTKTDGGYHMQNEALEYEFLYHVVPKLQKLVQMYATTAVRNRLVRKETHPAIRVKHKKRERTNWLEFKFEMDGISDNQIREILAALEEKRKYYRLRNGSLLSLETNEMEEIHRFLNTVPVQDENFEAKWNLPVSKSLHLLDSIDNNEVFTAEDSFRQFLDQLLHPGKLNFEVPAELDNVLRDYQKQGYKWMKTLASYGFGGVLADDMGLGKTLQSITYIVSELASIRERKNPVLIVCPSSLTYNWLNEILKFASDLRAVVIDGNQSKRENLQQNKEMDVIITSYPLLRRDHKWYENQSFHTVFFDEAQAFKNPATQTARTVKRIKADNRFGLTGTPVENSIEELWSIYHVVFPELFQGLKEYSYLTRKTIARRVRPFLLRRMKEDVLAELPEKEESLELTELLPEQKKLYAAYLAKLRTDTLKHLDKDTIRKNRIKILAGLTRLRQICCHPSLFVDGYEGSSAKFQQLLQIVEESRRAGRRVLIFSQFTKMLKLIGKELTMRGQPYFYLDGETPPPARVETCNRFNEGERDLFLISLKAGGTGLNLTGADTVILYDLWWNPAVEEQAADRTHRIGQDKIVKVIKLVARGTIEEKMNELQDKKRELIADIVDSEEHTSVTLTEEDLREIFMG
ncbi:DEAD/DEAH box helicase [Pseudalkalibacillus hwajinpoensis]|uniref:DEAD/DEAH box helicase n=1 Tax=Guptibacillus hwajinpoensis TaxID=208199 RepID=A0A4U1MEI0_9BACL|nr:DEAD/DEAH box helicase [Pseudalkalibacillus hwajinpoensis]TKD69213.1 DEAD/DEAH box helicase [Pseudalkalibacillus hwajinpoensis]